MRHQDNTDRVMVTEYSGWSNAANLSEACLMCYILWFAPGRVYFFRTLVNIVDTQEHPSFQLIRFSLMGEYLFVGELRLENLKVNQNFCLVFEGGTNVWKVHNLLLATISAKEKV